MAIQPYELVLNDKTEGVVMVCTTTGLPLPLTQNAFTDLDDCEAFLQWCYASHGDARDYNAESLSALVDKWRAEREPGS